ncbi:hypothetical protein RUM43_012512 [Polyplax serrata]|uniref:Uncharacterized protein n=1 Tax=Polyplax serrata TaxID=468196 RepID=A0AAN8RZG0_POLSC
MENYSRDVSHLYSNYDNTLFKSKYEISRVIYPPIRPKTNKTNASKAGHRENVKQDVFRLFKLDRHFHKSRQQCKDEPIAFEQENIGQSLSAQLLSQTTCNQPPTIVFLFSTPIQSIKSRPCYA